MRYRRLAPPILWTAVLLAVVVFAFFLTQERPLGDTYEPVDTQPSGQPLSPNVAVSRITVPPGFKVTLAAAEPYVRQPIAITYDDRGRVWVAESYSYDGSDFTDENNDRILIFDDQDGDGVFETRHIFRDGLSRLTGLVWGFGGVWVASAPHLLFIPDRDGDDRPDAQPVVHLDGWTLKAEHNSVNGLSWGPDGWLYGRHGIKEPSRPGRPGVPVQERPEVSCGIWRYHPTRHVFEVVVDGTVNPWGLDFDDHGQMFMNTSVVDPLWHVVPGSHFTRWQGRTLSMHAHVYEFMEATSDHSHRPLITVPGSLPGDDGSGGGHSHVEVMIYLGDRWPDSYRGGLFMNNIMGRRVNRERLSRHDGFGRFIARHEPDFLRVDDPWFRGVSLQYGPDGDVVLTDWSDNGECHDRDGVHRRSGRIYKISWGDPRHVDVAIERASDEQLVALQFHRNDWFVRHARRLLQERANTGRNFAPVHSALRRHFDQETETPRKLRALWALHVTHGASPDWLASLLNHEEESVRYWAVRLLVDAGPPAPDIQRQLVARAEIEGAWLVRMGLASALLSVDERTRWDLGTALAFRTNENEDANFVRLLWSGWQPVVPVNADAALRLAANLRNTRLRQWLPRRLAETANGNPAILDPLLKAIAASAAGAVRIDFMSGMEAGLANHDYPMLAGLRELLHTDYAVGDERQRLAALFLGAKLRDTVAIELLCAELRNTRQSTDVRTRILHAVLPMQPAPLIDDLLRFIDRGDLVVPSLRALAAFDDPRIALAILGRYDRLEGSERSSAIDTLLSRPQSVHALLDAIAEGRLAKADISQFQARQAAAAADPELRRRFDDLWGAVNTSPREAVAQIRKLRAILKDQEFMRTADLELGRAHFEKRCMSCHTLFDRGGKLGPDLTGSGRKDLDYLLINILDPNAAIPTDWRLTVITLTDGRVVSGSINAERENSITLQTAEGAVTLERTSIRSIDRLATSLMPTGLVDDLTAAQVRDLFAFLMSDAGAR